MNFIKKMIVKGMRWAGSFLPDLYPVSTRFFQDPLSQIFFGYYDVSPFSNDGRFILATRTKLGNESPHDKHSSLEIGYFNLKDQGFGFIKITQSNAWNWQQGCRLQWLPGKDNFIIFNDFSNNRLSAQIFNIVDGAHLSSFDMPIYAVSPDGTEALGLDFFKLHQYRPGYGYSNGDGSQFSAKDAVYKVHLSSGRVENIISSSQVRDLIGVKNEEKDYINHLCYAPDGKTFLFFYIRFVQGKRTTYLCLADANGGNIRHILQGYSPSHYAWKSDGTLLVTALSHDNRHIEYLLVDTSTSIITELRHDGLNVDGHPTFLHSKAFLSDTYPSRLGFQTVFIDRIDTEDRLEIASFYLPSEFSGEKRCDLHPRISQDGKHACIDVVRKDRRAMAVFPLEKSNP